ncbi:MAG: hypothetical protein IJQ56_11590, partial [Synergistaceae bacterium]|nr:hypothetical protein [Synergistaceae bacterium]
MKKFFYAVLFLCLIVSGAWADVEINAANFPDKNFRDYLSGNFDTDNDGMLNNEEIAQIIGIYLYGQTISSLKGIEYLTA